MKNRLILIEGIPGSGKTTIARKTKEYLESKGVKAKLYNEGDAHPADLAWISCIPLGEYEKLLKNNPEQADLIRSYTQFGEGYALVAYIKIRFSSKDDPLLKYFEAHEVYDAKTSTETFESLHLIRWDQFAKDIHDEEVAIFECAYLQNHINELMGFHNKDTDYITDYLMKLIHTVNSLNPKLIYLSQPDIKETIGRVAKERVTSDKTRWEDWIDLVIRYVENSPYGRSHQLKGYDGVIHFFEDRKKIELSVIDQLTIDKTIIQNLEYNWDEIFRQVVASIDI